MSSRKYPDRDLKLLWGFSAGRCNHPDCKLVCIADSTVTDKNAIFGKIAHIYAHSNGGPRSNSNMTSDQRDRYENWLLLCSNHHDIIDKQPDSYPAEKLFKWKEEHESWVRESLGTAMPNVSFAELEIVTKAIISNPISPTGNFSVIPPKDKLVKNSLSSKVEQLVIMGMVKSKEVENFVRDISKSYQSFPEQISNGFTKQYKVLKDGGLEGDALFEALHEFSSAGNKDFSHQSAGLAVLVYLFEKCEVFER
jgi:hypothetical protein